MYHVSENYPAAPETKTDESNTSAAEAHRQQTSGAWLTAGLTATPANCNEQ
jgi:hypothetical protein